jgi:hypothetical protein
MKTKDFDVTPYKRPRIAPHEQEWGGVQDVQKQFGIKETHLYQLMKEGRIKSVLIRGRGKTRGKRLINFASVRAMLSSEGSRP